MRGSSTTTTTAAPLQQRTSAGDGHTMHPGQRVRLLGLKARADLNGAHTTVREAASPAEAAELQQKRRVKVCTALTDETLSVKLSNIEVVTETVEGTLYSTRDFAVSRTPGRGCVWTATRNIPAGRVLLREEPIVVHRMADYSNDLEMQALHAQITPFIKQNHYPAEATKLFDRIAARIAEPLVMQLPPTSRTRFMALSDAFAAPGEAKTAGGVYRANAISREDTEGGVVYEVLSRANHSCAPNLSIAFVGFVVEVATIGSVACGQELCLCYIDSLLKQPTAKRREALHAKYNFTCTCSKCGELPQPPPEDEACPPSPAPAEAGGRRRPLIY